MNRPAVDIKEIVSMLGARAESICRELFPGGHFDRNRMVAGSLDGEPGSSLSVHFKSTPPGNWRDFAADKQGDILALVAHCKFGGDMREAVRWARDFLGLGSLDNDALAKLRRETKEREVIQRREAAVDADKRRRWAFRIWGHEGRPELEDTPVEQYLNSRGIELAKLKSYGAIRFNPNCYASSLKKPVPAMVACMTGSNGKFAAVHRTYLEPDGERGWRKRTDILDKKGKPKSKWMLGDFMGAHVSLNKGHDKVPLSKSPPGSSVLITEGIEDGLTYAMATPDVRVVAAGSLANMTDIWVPAQVTRRYLLRDDDAGNKQAQALFERAVEEHRRQGADVRIVHSPGGTKDPNEFLMKMRSGENA